MWNFVETPVDSTLGCDQGSCYGVFVNTSRSLNCRNPLRENACANRTQVIFLVVLDEEGNVRRTGEFSEGGWNPRTCYSSPVTWCYLQIMPSSMTVPPVWYPFLYTGNTNQYELISRFMTRWTATPHLHGNLGVYIHFWWTRYDFPASCILDLITRLWFQAPMILELRSLCSLPLFYLVKSQDDIA